MRPLVFALALGLYASGAWADMYGDCNQSADPDRRIRGCTQIIKGGQQETQKKTNVSPTPTGATPITVNASLTAPLRTSAKPSSSTRTMPTPTTVARGRTLDGKKPDLGLPDAERAVELVPDNAKYLDTRGQIYAALGRREEAIADLERALQIDPSLDETQAALDALAPSTNNVDCKKFFPSVGMTLTVPCE